MQLLEKKQIFDFELIKSIFKYLKQYLSDPIDLKYIPVQTQNATEYIKHEECVWASGDNLGLQNLKDSYGYSKNNKTYFIDMLKIPLGVC